MIDIKKVSFIIFNFYVFPNEKPTKKPCSGKCSNKDNEETIVVNLKGNSGEQYEHNERSKDNEDDNDDSKPNNQTEDDKKFDFEEYTYIPKSTNFYLLSSTCSSLILKIKQFADVTTFQDSLKNAKTEADLEKIKETLTELNKKRDDLIIKIKEKLDKVELSLIDLGCSNFLLNSYKINDLETLIGEIDKKIQKYFDDKINPLKAKIENYCKKNKIKNSDEYKNYESYIKNPDNKKKLNDYLTKIIDFEKEIYKIWKESADLAELKNAFDALIKEINDEISTVKDNGKKVNFTKEIQGIVSKGDTANANNNNDGVKSCIDEVQKLKENVKKVLDEEKKEKELEENINKIEEIINSIKGLIDEFSKDVNKGKYSNKITGDFITEFNNLKEKKEDLQKKSVNDLNKKQTDLSDLQLKIEEYKNLVDKFVKERNEINQKNDKLTNFDAKLKQNYKDIIATYKSDIENKKDISMYSDRIKNICELFEKSDNNIKKINSLKNLTVDEKSDYINKIKNLDYSVLKSNAFKNDPIKKFNEEIDNIFKDAENVNKKALLEAYKDSIMITIKVKNKGGKDIDKEINVVELLKDKKSFKTTTFNTAKTQIDKDIKDNMLGYINYRKNEKKNGSLKILNEIFKSFINGKNEVSFNCNITNLPKKIKDKISIIPRYIEFTKRKTSTNDDVIFIYNLLRKLLLNIEIDYCNNTDDDKYKNFKKTNFDIDFIIPLDS